MGGTFLWGLLWRWGGVAMAGQPTCPPWASPARFLPATLTPFLLQASFFLINPPHQLSQLTLILRRTEGVIDEEEQEQLYLR